ncbi:SDR family oxidoreductase [Caenimonas koreensis]|uniref:SDR family NAD(P)-dependent oxidoreductase n=1 Tax=Caenimonas koreensis DSM 17982 TaxID=1121255 RepID=A0A844AQC4_9BURK|nr:SDR family NAD(P)-dependent oxidoreductase [Caenimonas koreensis]MRD46355.1 SDR family NAD(P)-dependent oxidoreductase [Caenimonas koreensis DSM 17982]
MKITKAKVAAITGAGSGIGRALALELARRGCALALADINAARVQETASMAQALGAKAAADVLDVADRAAFIAWASKTRDAFGNVHMIFNNAGVALSASAEHTTPADFEWLMGINFWGVINGTQAFLPHLRASGQGHIVNISSLFGIMAMPGSSAYNASKFAVRGYTEALRMELELEGAPVSVTCVHPGGVGTNIARAARMDPAMVAKNGGDEQRQREFMSKLLQVTTPESAALQILRGVERNAPRVLVGPDARFMDIVTRLLGPGYRKLVMHKVRRIRAQMSSPASAAQ